MTVGDMTFPWNPEPKPFKFKVGDVVTYWAGGPGPDQHWMLVTGMERDKYLTHYLIGIDIDHVDTWPTGGIYEHSARLATDADLDVSMDFSRPNRQGRFTIRQLLEELRASGKAGEKS